MRFLACASGFRGRTSAEEWRVDSVLEDLPAVQHPCRDLRAPRGFQSRVAVDVAPLDGEAQLGGEHRELGPRLVAEAAPVGGIDDQVSRARVVVAFCHAEIVTIVGEGRAPRIDVRFWSIRGRVSTRYHGTHRTRMASG